MGNHATMGGVTKGVGESPSAVLTSSPQASKDGCVFLDFLVHLMERWCSFLYYKIGVKDADARPIMGHYLASCESRVATALFGH